MTTTINELTPDQKKLIETIKQEYLDIVFVHKPKLDKKKAESWVGWLYEFCGYKKPPIHVAKDPQDAQDIANKLCGTKGEVYNFSSYGNVGDYGWIAFYDFFTRIGVIDNPDFQEYKKLIETGVYDQIQFDEACILIPLPNTISRDERAELHCADGPAIEWENGFKRYFWHGHKVTQKLIETPEKITRKEIVGEKNAETRRAMMEKMGPELFANAIGTVEIDEGSDGINPAKLLRSKESDSDIGDHLYFLKLVDSSTDRIYFMNIDPEVGRQEDAETALAWTFGMTKEEYKQNLVVQT